MNESVEVRMTTDGPPKRPRRATGSSDTSPLSSLLGLILFASLLMFAGCHNMFLSARDSDIKDATHAIETARDDAQRAKAYSSRGIAYSEKARYSRIMKLVPNDEYERLFDLAIKDHNQAVALDPANSEVYFNRAQAYYDRGNLDLVFNQGSGKAWFDAAAADFEKVTAKNPHNELALDRLGLTYEQNGENDKAIQAYTQEMALNPFGKQRLADAYCGIGFRHELRKDIAGATIAFQKSMEFGLADDKSCPVDPFGEMARIYTTEIQYDKAWDMVHKAQKAKRWIAPEQIEQLRKASGRKD